MTSILNMSVCMCAASLISPMFALANDPNLRRDEAQKTLKKHLATMPSAERATVVDINSPSLVRAFSDVEFFGLRFRRYPVAVRPTAPLKPSNVFAVVGEDVTHISDQRQLDTFLHQRLTGELTEDERIAATASYLTLMRELNEDGFFQFELSDIQIEDSSCLGELRVTEKQGDSGKLTVRMTFDDRRFTGAKVDGKINRGIRPRCQAIRLLDADHDIREIMRQDILVMGRRCKTYLEEVKATAGPELEQAIDDVWQQILDEDR